MCGVMLILVCFLCFIIANRLKINITPYGENFHYLNYGTVIKFKIRRITVLESFLPLRNYGIDFWFSGNNGNMMGRCI